MKVLKKIEFLKDEYQSIIRPTYIKKNYINFPKKNIPSYSKQGLESFNSILTHEEKQKIIRNGLIRFINKILKNP